MECERSEPVEESMQIDTLGNDWGRPSVARPSIHGQVNPGRRKLSQLSADPEAVRKVTDGYRLRLKRIVHGAATSLRERAWLATRYREAGV